MDCSTLFIFIAYSLTVYSLLVSTSTLNHYLCVRASSCFLLCQWRMSIMSGGASLRLGAKSYLPNLVTSMPTVRLPTMPPMANTDTVTE